MTISYAEIMTFLEKIQTLRDGYHSGLCVIDHEYCVAILSSTFASILDLHPKKCDEIYQAGFLHDIGNIVIPPEILAKPTALTAAEMSIVQQHAEAGYTILSSLSAEVIQLAATVAREHHENYDGTGYPQGLKGNEISLEARIVAICDVYDALRRMRSYKPGLNHEKTITLMIEAYTEPGCLKFDPYLFKVFLENQTTFQESWDENAYHHVPLQKLGFLGLPDNHMHPLPYRDFS